MKNELYHHGVRGMKWGVRRYQNYDGSYTQAGLKRYKKAEADYDEADQNYKTIKQLSKSNNAYVTNPDGSETKLVISKNVVKEAKDVRKVSKANMEKHYKHLKQDKLADQGKEIYRKGGTITGNANVTGIIGGLASASAAAATYNYKTGQLGNENVTKFLGGLAIGSMSLAAAKKAVDYSQDRKLRAYYTHTSNY